MRGGKKSSTFTRILASMYLKIPVFFLTLKKEKFDVDKMLNS